MDGVSIRHQFVEHLRTLRKRLVVFAVFVEQADGLAIAATGVAILLHLPVEVAEVEQQHSLLHATTRGLGVALLVGVDGLHGVLLCQVDIAHGIIYLVEVFLVLVRGSHAAQFADHLLCLSLRHHLRHGDAGVEFQFVGWVLGDDLAKRLVRFGMMAQGRLDLSHQIPFARFLLLSHLVLDDLAQVGDGLLQFTRVDIIVSKGIVPLLGGPPVDAVALHVADHVLGIIEPVLLDVAFGKPCPRLAVDGGLRLVDSRHVGEGRRSLVKRSLVKLGAAHKHPRFPKEGVVFFAAEPLDVLLRLASRLVPFGLALDAVARDGFLRLLYRPVVVALAQFAAAFVAHRIEREHLREVVLVAFLLFQTSVDVGQFAIIIGIIACIERPPPTGLGGVLLGRAATKDHDDDGQ